MSDNDGTPVDGVLLQVFYERGIGYVLDNLFDSLGCLSAGTRRQTPSGRPIAPSCSPTPHPACIQCRLGATSSRVYGSTVTRTGARTVLSFGGRFVPRYRQLSGGH